MRIFASMWEDAQQGWVWLCVQGLPPRSVVKITNTQTGASIYCEALYIDNNFLRTYNQSPRHPISEPECSLVANAWYRAKLGCPDTQRDVPLTVKRASSFFGRYMACVHHPQAVVRVASWLGALSLALGVISLGLGVYSTLPERSSSSASSASRAPMDVPIDHLVLYASLKDGHLIGKVFNTDASFVVTRLTIEAIPNDETNIFNRNTPRFFDVATGVLPNTMSTEFRVETGQLNPAFHSLRISRAFGLPRSE